MRRSSVIPMAAATLLAFWYVLRARCAGPTGRLDRPPAAAQGRVATPPSSRCSRSGLDQEAVRRHGPAPPSPARPWSSRDCWPRTDPGRAQLSSTPGCAAGPRDDPLRPARRPWPPVGSTSPTSGRTSRSASRPPTARSCSGPSTLRRSRWASIILASSPRRRVGHPAQRDRPAAQAGIAVEPANSPAGSSSVRSSGAASPAVSSSEVLSHRGLRDPQRHARGSRGSKPIAGR